VKFLHIAVAAATAAGVALIAGFVRRAVVEGDPEGY